MDRFIRRNTSFTRAISMATNQEKDKVGNQGLLDTGAEKLIVNRRLLLHNQHRTAGNTNEAGLRRLDEQKADKNDDDIDLSNENDPEIRSEVLSTPIRPEDLSTPIRSEDLSTPIRSELLPKTEGDEDNAGGMEFHHGAQAHPMMMMLTNDENETNISKEKLFLSTDREGYYQRKMLTLQEKLKNPDLNYTEREALMIKESSILKKQHRAVDKTNRAAMRRLKEQNVDQIDDNTFQSDGNDLQIRSELLPKKSEGDEANADSMESQSGAQAHPMMMMESQSGAQAHPMMMMESQSGAQAHPMMMMESQSGAQAHPMMMMESGGSIANSGMKKKSIPPAKKSLGLPICQKKSNKPKPMRQRSKSMNNDDDDEDDEDGEELDDADDDMTGNGNTATSSSALATTTPANDTTAEDDDDED